jgi:hypothetical protein
VVRASAVNGNAGARPWLRIANALTGREMPLADFAVVAEGEFVVLPVPLVGPAVMLPFRGHAKID